jgi:ribosome-binding protein aMBF1 (putative translation factor)
LIPLLGRVLQKQFGYYVVMMKSFSSVKKRWLRDPKFKKAYDALGPEFALAETVIRRRLEKGLTQAQLARKIGTKQSAISRLESGTYNPTLGVLRKVASALGAKVSISIR